jgi:hypothetical protein
MHKDKKTKKKKCLLRVESCENVNASMPHVLVETFVSLAATTQQKQIKGSLFQSEKSQKLNKFDGWQSFIYIYIYNI